MTDVTAGALRRAALVTGALAATLAAHAAAQDGLHPTVVAPAVWIGLIGVTLVGGLALGRGGFRPWSGARILAATLVAQALAHVAMWVAPWAFGLVEHGAEPLVSGGALVFHLLVAAGLTFTFRAGQRLLLGLIHRIRSLVATVRRPALPRPIRTVRIPDAPAAARDRERPATSRGPPRPVRPRTLAVPA